jgi:hypothetical protein
MEVFYAGFTASYEQEVDKNISLSGRAGLGGREAMREMIRYHKRTRKWCRRCAPYFIPYVQTSYQVHAAGHIKASAAQTVMSRAAFLLAGPRQHAQKKIFSKIKPTN